MHIISQNCVSIQAWIAQMVAHWLGTWEEQGSNLGKVDNFLKKLSN